jgi:uncharacterized protein
MDPLLVLFGFGVGILVGTTGMGGGSLMTPLLILLFGIKPVVAVGTDLAYAAITKTAGGMLHWRKGTVQKDLALWLAVGSCPGAVAGVILLDKLGLNDTLLPLISAALLLTGALVMLRALIWQGVGERETAPLTRAGKAFAVVLGASVGFVLGVTSAGSGALIAVGLILLFRLTPTRVVGTDVFHAAILLWAAGLAHVSAGNVDFGLVGNILIGSIPGVWVGSHWSVRVNPAVLRTTLAIVLIGAGLALLIKAGLDLPLEILIPFPVAVIVLLIVTIARSRRSSKRRDIQIPSGM